MDRKMASVEQAFSLALERYGEFGVDVETALDTAARIPVSLHCWQGDDVSGFEHPGTSPGGGLQVTGAYPGKARTPEELQGDLDRVLALLPGTHRLNLHAIYATITKPVTRDELEPAHFAGWMDWAAQRGIHLDFNGSFFAHPLAADGFTLSHPDQGTREFWIRHAKACRRIGEAMGRAQGSPCVVNIWIPDGYKDTPADRWAPRQRLRDSLDDILSESLERACLRDALESKLFGIGSESYVVGSHEFCLAYALEKGILYCLDAGHFHPTETIHDKISSILPFAGEILLHVSRGVRWDSDHVVTMTDDLMATAREVVRPEARDRVHVELDFFDASINRIAAWVIGARAMRKALLGALLEPVHMLQALEVEGDLTGRLALQEACRTLPMGTVWEMLCRRMDVPGELEWMANVRRHEMSVLKRRNA